MRQSGILMHLTSLPSPEGIGTLGAEARKFVDFLAEAGCEVWQVLPISPTGFAESPYQCFSTFAGNPLLIDLRTLVKERLLPRFDWPFLGDDPERVDFSQVIGFKRSMLEKAFQHTGRKLQEKLARFREEQAWWLEDYALFMALKERYGGISWQDWPEEDIRLRRARAMRRCREELREQITEHVFIQYLFFRQWDELKAYANGKGVDIFGDMPIYVAEDSADAWANPGIFQLDSQRRPTHVAGVPPDYFSWDGQRWGNPLYNWRALAKRGYDWWIKRLKWMERIYDITRIDHFIGFANYYAVPATEKTARNGAWHLGPGKRFFEVVKRELPQMRIVAEDLGAVNERVRSLMAYCGYPGMKVLTFAFSGDPHNEHLVKYHTPNTVVYTGTHDNNTLLGWWNHASQQERNSAILSLGIRHDEDELDAIILGTLKSPARLAIIPMQDLLRLGEEARMNLPGTIGTNWLWRMKPGAATRQLAKKLREMNRAAGRGGKEDLG